MSQNRKGRWGGRAGHRSGPWGAVLAFTAAAALLAGLTSTPVPGDAVEAVPDMVATAEESSQPGVPPVPEIPRVPDISESPAAVDPELPELDGLFDDNLADLDLGLLPMDVGPDGLGLTAPYVYWRAVDDAGKLVPGASFELQGPATSNLNWGSSDTVEDNTGQPDYIGLDRDPDPGEFAVMNSGTHRISDTSRYRVRLSQSPSGYQATTTAWQEIPGTGAALSRGGGNRTYNFGDFRFLNLSKELSCTPGTFYSVSSSGTLYEVSSGTVSTIGNWDKPGGAVNALGISQSGTEIYALARDASFAGTVSSILRYTPATGVFERLPNTDLRTKASSLIAGAVNLSDGHYFFGGFNSTGSRFQIYRFTGSGSPSYVGYFNTGTTTGTANGDMAFDSAGNLYVVRSGTETSIYTVTAANLAAANGGQIPATSTHSARLTGLSDVNGAAFDADGSIYLGNTSRVNKFDPTNWENLGTVTTNLRTSTDLASCSTPATLTVTKNVIGRVNDTDQFRLAVTRNNDELAAVDTKGTEDGVQDSQVGPMAVRSGNTYTVRESFIGGAAAEDYTTSLRCVDEIGIELINEAATTAEVDIPYGAVVKCEFTNAPLVSFVDIVKHVKEENDESTVASGWTVGAAAQNPQFGDVTADPNAATQETDKDGVAKWKFHYETSETITDIKVSEQQQNGYEFESGTCVVTPPTGGTREIELTESEDTIGGIVDGVVPGSRVACEFHNKKMSSELTLLKEITGDFDPDSDVNQWVLKAEGEDKTYTGTTGAAGITDVKVRPGEYTLSEALDSAHESKTEGYTWERLRCVDSSAEEALTLLDVDMTTDPTDPTDLTVKIPNGGDVECTFTNATRPGSLAWNKIAAGSDLPLAGSEWTLTGPGHAEGTVITDNGAGSFLVENLQWGEYSLTETKAPAGYQLSDPAPSFVATITPAKLHWDHTSESEAGGIENEQVRPVTLPIAGGTGTWMFAGGGTLLLLAAAGGWLYITRRSQLGAGER